MKNLKKICIFAVIVLVLCSLLSVSAFAQEALEDAAKDATKLDMNMKPDTFKERMEYALKGTVTGMVMIFSVLGVLAIIVSISKVMFYDIPQKKAKKENEKAEQPSQSAQIAQPTAPQVQAQDDGELAAVITAAIAAMIESSDYKNEFAGGFRVVSFKRTTSGAWNKK